MQVSEVRLNLLKTDNAVRAIGSFSLDEAFAVRGIRVMEDKSGRNFVAFPSREKSDGSYEDIAFPLSKELYASITGAILEEYRNQVEKQEQSQEQKQTQDQQEAKSQEADLADTPIRTEAETKAAQKRGKSR